jgi:N-acetylmuramoyl-L-alanine amidase
MKREFKDINEIIIHCSDSDFGDVDLIDQWHKERGWDGVGYHYVITNGIIAHGNEYDPKMDGEIQKGRELAVMGAHCRGHNYNSIGICLIGRHHFTGRQLLESLPNLLRIFTGIVNSQKRHVRTSIRFCFGCWCGL